MPNRLARPGGWHFPAAAALPAPPPADPQTCPGEAVPAAATTDCPPRLPQLAPRGLRVPGCPSRNRPARRPPPACRAPDCRSTSPGASRAPHRSPPKRPRPSTAHAPAPAAMLCATHAPLFPHRPGVSVRRPTPCPLPPSLAGPQAFDLHLGNRNPASAARGMPRRRLISWEMKIQPRRARHTSKASRID